MKLPPFLVRPSLAVIPFVVLTSNVSNEASVEETAKLHTYMNVLAVSRLQPAFDSKPVNEVVRIRYPGSRDIPASVQLILTFTDSSGSYQTTLDESPDKEKPSINIRQVDVLCREKLFEGDEYDGRPVTVHGHAFPDGKERTFAFVRCEPGHCWAY